MAKRDFTPSGRGNPCAICGRGAANASKKGGDCRLMPDGIWLCHTHTGDGLEPGDNPPSGADYRFLLTSTAAQGFGMWKPEADWEDSDSANNNHHHRQHRPTPFRIESPAAMAAIAGSIDLARLPGALPEPPPEHLPNGYLLNYSPTQRVLVQRNAQEKKFPPQHLTSSDPATWTTGAGPDPWPLWRQAEAVHHGPGHWITEAEGEKCSSWLRAGGLIAISQPGHAHKPEQIQARYLALKQAGIRGVVYLADNDEQGRQRAGQSLQAAAAIGLPLLVLHAGDVWPGLPTAGSIDDAPGSAAQRVADIQQAIPDAIAQQQQQQGEDDRPLTSSELIGQVLTAQLASNQDGYLCARAELISRFRMTDQMIQKACFQLMEQQAIGATIKPTTNHVDMGQVEALRYRMDGHMLVGDIAMVGAAYSTGKTLLLAAKADAHIRGEGFLDRDADDTTPGRVLFIATDSGTAPLLAAWHQLGIKHLEDPYYISDGPEQRVFVWGFEPDQGQAAWYCTPADILRLQQFIKRQGITYVVIDSVKSVCGDDIDYTNNQAVRALLRYLRNIVCKSTGVSIELINHEGSTPRSFAGAKSWAEEISMAALLTKVLDEKGNHIANQLEFTKDRAAPPGMACRTVVYTLDRDGQLVLSQSQEKTGTCRELLCDLLWQLHKEGHQEVHADQLASMAAFHGKSRKTVDNTLSKIAGTGKGQNPSPAIRPSRGRYALTPAEQQRRQVAEQLGQVDQLPLAVLADQPAPPEAGDPQPDHAEEGSLNRALVGGRKSPKKLVIERVLETSYPQKQGGKWEKLDSAAQNFPLPTPETGVGRTQTPVQDSVPDVLPPTGNGYRAREATANTTTNTPSPVLSQPEQAANAARSNLTSFKPGETVFIAHQRMTPGRLHQATVTRTTNASVSFEPPIPPEALLVDPTDPDQGHLQLPQPLASSSSTDCTPQLGTASGCTVTRTEDGVITFTYIHSSGDTITRTIAPVRVGIGDLEQESACSTLQDQVEAAA